MSVSLPDVNVLIALAWPNHVHHSQALNWFKHHHSTGWATCPATQSGFVRIFSNPQITSQSKTPREALAHLRKIVALPHHVFWADDMPFVAGDYLDETKLLSFRQVSDAHLLGIALRHGGRLATLDRGIAALVLEGLSADEVLAVIR
jgi:uncharacterized protein